MNTGNYNKQKNEEVCDSFTVDFGKSRVSSSPEGNVFKCALTKEIKVGDLPKLKPDETVPIPEI